MALAPSVATRLREPSALQTRLPNVNEGEPIDKFDPGVLATDSLMQVHLLGEP